MNTIKDLLRPKTKEEIYSIVSTSSEKEIIELLINSCFHNDEFFVTFLLEHYPTLTNSFDRSGNTPLITICIGGYINLFNILIKHNVDINLNSIDHCSPLEVLLWNNHYEFAKILIELGCNCDTNGRFGSPLYLLQPNTTVHYKKQKCNELIYLINNKIKWEIKKDVGLNPTSLEHLF